MNRDRRPPSLSLAVSLVWLSLSVVITSLFSFESVPLGLVGILIIIGAFFRQSRQLLSIGVALVVVGVIVAGVVSMPIAWTLLAGTVAILGWDAGSTTLSLGEQLGRQAQTHRIEAMHIGSSAAVGFGTVAIAYTVIYTAGGARTVSAILLLVVAVAILTVSYFRTESLRPSLDQNYR